MVQKLKENFIENGYTIVLVPCFKKYGRRLKGYICQDTLEIYIDKNLSCEEKIVTLIHELLHDIYEDWSERKIEKESFKIFQRLSERDLGFLQFLVS